MPSRRRSSRWRVPPFLGLSIVAHGCAYLFILAAGLDSSLMVPGASATLEPPTPTEEERILDAACVAEVIAMRARAGACLLVGKLVPGCDEVELRPLGDDLLACWHARPIDITLVEPEPLSPFAAKPDDAAAEIEREKKLEEERKPEEDPAKKGQVVEVARPEVEVRPDDARFLSEYDTKVEKETRARGHGEPGAARREEVPPHQAAPPVASPVRRAAEAGGKGALAMRGGPNPPAKHLGQLDGAAAPPIPGGTSVPEGTTGGGGAPALAGGPGAAAGANPPGLADLRPTGDAIARAVGSGSNDYLKDVDEGEETLVNSKRWKYASFFNRVKRAVSQSWHPDTAFRLRDPTGQIYGQKNRLTVLKVSLQPDGTIRDILVERPCGVDFLDDEAVSAFRDAQPFPNPPNGLVDKESNLITFRFGFFFEITETGGFKVFRYSN